MKKMCAVAILAFIACASPEQPEDPGDAILVSRDELLRELKSAPDANEAREKKLVELYKQAGAPGSDIKLQPLTAGGKQVNNVVVVKKGETDGLIIIGGHLDKVPPGHGIIDDWSGACMASNVFQAFKNVKTRHTLIFIGFAAEELGLFGSAQYAKSMSEQEVKNCTAMVNLECLGPAVAHIWTNGSTDSLEAVLRTVALERKLDLKDHELHDVGADSESFEKRGIPAITIDGLPKEKFPLIHSDQDRYENVNGDNYYNSYKLVVAFVKKLDQMK